MKKIQIKNFKCLKDFEISELKRVNLFTGRNNTGKSTLLEALVLLDKYPDVRISEILNLRDVLNQNKTDSVSKEINKKILSTLFYERNYENVEINIHSDIKTLDLSLKKYIKEGGKAQYIDDESNYDFYNEGLRIKYNHEGLSKDSPIPIDEKVNFSDQSSSHSFTHCKYITTSGNELSLDNASHWDRIGLESSKKKNIISTLQIIEPKIEDLIFVADTGNSGKRHAEVSLKNGTKAPIKSMGDGINKIFSIILALNVSENGYLLIDEFENGLHHSVQQKLWEIIFQTAEKLNVQVFTTTHSNDTINSFAKVLESDDDFSGSLYRMANVKDKIKAYSFSKEEIIRAADQNINIR